MNLGLMKPEHPRFEEFLDRLYGPEGCNWREEIPGDDESITWDCDSEDRSRPRCRKILAAMGASDADIEASLSAFDDFGGRCDCEVMMNGEHALENALEERELYLT